MELVRSHRILDVFLKVALTGFADGLDVGIRESRMTAGFMASAAGRMELSLTEIRKAMGGGEARRCSRV